MNKELSLEYQYLSKDMQLIKIEQDFWRIVKSKGKKKLTVHYATDLESEKYIPAETLNDTSKLCLNKMYQNIDSLLQFSTVEDFPGITTTMLYMGCMFGSFSWHFEHTMMGSFNYMHDGDAKVWYGIPENSTKDFENYAKRKHPNVFKKNNDVLINHMIPLMISPEELVDNGIEVYRVVQNPGEVILSFPGSVHCGISLGMTLAESVGIFYTNYLPFYDKVMDLYRERDMDPIFPISYVLVKNIENLDSVRFTDKYVTRLIDKFQKVMEKEISMREKAIKIGGIPTFVQDLNRSLDDEDVGELGNEVIYLSYAEGKTGSTKFCLLNLEEHKQNGTSKTVSL